IRVRRKPCSRKRWSISSRSNAGCWFAYGFGVRPLRFTFILILAAFGTGLAAVGGWRYARASAPVNGPIFVISIDTLRADHLPVYGYRKVRTPAIDALAHDGVVFERAYSHSPQTLPAHASL